VVSDDAALKKGQVGSRSPGNRVYVTPALIGLNVIVFGLMVGNGVPALEPAPHSMLDWGADFGPLTLGGQWWRMLSSIFLHRGIFHLLGNMIVLASIGRFMEKVLGNAAYLILYLVAGIAGNMTSLAWHPFAMSEGASGAILGLYGALLAVFLYRRQTVPAETWARRPKVMAALVGCSLLYGLFSREVNVAAHLGGLGAGFLLGLFLTRPISQEAVAERRRRNTVAGICGIAMIYATVVVLGKNLPKEGDLDATIAQCDRAIQLNPKFAEAYCNRGVAKAKKGDLDGALIDCDRAIELNPKLAGAYSSRGSIEAQKGDFEASIRDCDRAIQLEPERGELYTVRGAAKAKKGDLSGAMADCDRAIQLDPKLVPAYSLRAAVREKNSDLEGAVADWNQAIQLNPKVTEANPSLAVAYYNRGSTFRGKKEYERRSAITVKRFV
jgi:membrane associated rhomboid family serine protease/Flp pilus assembly protein TadD